GLFPGGFLLGQLSVQPEEVKCQKQTAVVEPEKPIETNPDRPYIGNEQSVEDAIEDHDNQLDDFLRKTKPKNDNSN
ncbi:MAG: hypothetical protein CFH43_00336, partial [Proteobacteria bacterium]